MRSNDDLLSVQGNVYTLVDAEGYLVREDTKNGRFRYPTSAEAGEYTAGSGLTLQDNEFSVDFSVVAEKDEIVSYTAGSGLTLNDNQFAVDFTTVAQKSEIQTYSAGSGLSLSGGQFAVDTSVIATKSELFSGDYEDLTNKPDIPRKTSDIRNDSGYITSAAIKDLTFGKDYRYNTTSNNFEVSMEYPAVVQFSSLDAIANGTLNLAVLSSNVQESFNENIIPTIQVMIPYSVGLSTFNITGVYNVINIPSQIDYASGAVNYAVFTCRFIPYEYVNGTAYYKTQLNYAYSFKE